VPAGFVFAEGLPSAPHQQMSMWRGCCSQAGIWKLKLIGEVRQSKNKPAKSATFIGAIIKLQNQSSYFPVAGVQELSGIFPPSIQLSTTFNGARLSVLVPAGEKVMHSLPIEWLPVRSVSRKKN